MPSLYMRNMLAQSNSENLFSVFFTFILDSPQTTSQSLYVSIKKPEHATGSGAGFFLGHELGRFLGQSEKVFLLKT